MSKKRGRKPLPEIQKRKPFTIRVLDSTRSQIKDLEEWRGENGTKVVENIINKEHTSMLIKRSIGKEN
jgi:hypothetical protein